MSSNMKLVSFADLLDEQLVSSTCHTIFPFANNQPQPSPPATFSQIMESYRREGRGDVETLKAVLAAKQSEEDVSFPHQFSSSFTNEPPLATRKDP